MTSRSPTKVPTVSETVKRAAAITDPNDHDEEVDALVAAFEDDDRPVTVTNVAADLFETVRGIDPDGDSPAALMTAAVAGWLATHPDADRDPERALREAAKRYFKGRPPEPVQLWLDER
jgi:hypothetical protein